MRLISKLSVCISVVSTWFALESTAHAYPEFQYSTGATRCSECHFAPGGGGLINDYGRDEAGSTIAGSGDGRFLHGLTELPPWLAVGGDVRVAGLAKQVRDGQETAIFPMQADLYGRVQFGQWSLAATFGVLARIREPSPLTERLGSREHYVMFRNQAGDMYARAGRFFPIFGLRMADHTAYVRRYVGFHSLEEDYGVAAGKTWGKWEAHLSLTTPLAVHPVVGQRGFGGVFQLERSLWNDLGGISLQGKFEHNNDGTTTWLGSTVKRWFEAPSLMWMAEVDIGTHDASGNAISQMAAYTALYFRPGTKLSAQVAAHYFDSNVSLLGQEREAIDLGSSWFPRAHFEVNGLLRAETVNFTGDPTLLALLQLHYFL